MKKIVATSLFSLLLALTAFGQLKGGLKGGLSLADLIITDGAGYFGESDFRTKSSFHVGSYIHKDFSPDFGFQVEMLFSNKGCILDSDTLEGKVSLNYLNWPVLVTYQLGSRISFHAGVELGLLIAGEDIYRAFDMGIDVGAQYDISKKVLLGIRYNHGLPFRMEISSLENLGTAPAYQHSVIQFYLGFNLVNEPLE